MRLPLERLDVYFHATAHPKHQLYGGVFSDPILSQRPLIILQHLTLEQELLPVIRDALLLRDVLLECQHRHVVVQAIQRLSREVCTPLHEEFHATSKSEDQVEGGFTLDVIIAEGTSIIKLNTREDESLLVRGNTFFVLNHSFELLNSEVRGDIARDGLPCQGLDVNLMGARLHNHGHLPKFDLVRYRVDEFFSHEEGGCAIQDLVLDADLFSSLAQLASLHEVISC